MVHGRPTAEVAQAVTQPVILDGRKVEATRVRVRPGKDGRTLIDLTLVEGRNRVVRRWCEEMGLKVERLARLTYGPVRLGDLPSGESRPLTPDEEEMIYRSIKMSEGPVTRGARTSGRREGEGKAHATAYGAAKRDRDAKPGPRKSFIEKREAKRADKKSGASSSRKPGTPARESRAESRRKDVRSAKPRPSSDRDRRPKR
jgi:hypothetical protein